VSYDWSGSSTSSPKPDPVDAGPVIQVNADVVAGTSEQMADTAIDVVRSDLEDSRPFDEFGVGLRSASKDPTCSGWLIGSTSPSRT
jgi:hypothetical protein